MFGSETESVISDFPAGLKRVLLEMKCRMGWTSPSVPHSDGGELGSVLGILERHTQSIQTRHAGTRERQPS